jgi:hypothetical protein
LKVIFRTVENPTNIDTASHSGGQESLAAPFSGVPRNFLRGKGGGSTNSVEDRGQREWGSGGGSPLVRGSTQFVNE